MENNKPSKDRPTVFSEGLGAADEAMTGVAMQDAKTAQAERAQKSEGKGKSGRTADIMASLVNAVSNVPDSLATSFMVGVNPIHGLYATIVSPTVGGLLSSSHLMLVGVTVASALLARQAIAPFPEEQRLPALFTMVFLAGLFILAFGLLKLGRLRKYISYPVMRGFLYGVGVLLILSQSPALFGYEASGSNAILTFIDTFTHIPEWNWSAVLTSVVTLASIFLLRRTPLKVFSSAIALLIGSLLVYFAGLDNVQIVQDVSTIPRGLPELSLPALSLLSPQLIFSAFTMAVVISIQGLGVSQMAENPDGSPVNISRDLIAQGAASVGTGLFSGIPVGGSVGSTALNMSLGARSRLSSILTGVWMVAIVLLFAPIVEQVPMPSLTALIMMAGIGAVNVRDSISIMKSGWSAVLGFSITLLCILLFSIPIAVSAGIVLTIFMAFIRGANDISVMHLYKNEKGQLLEGPLPEKLTPGDPIVITVEGSLFFAGAQTLQEKLPQIGTVEHPVVIIRMRNQSKMGATLIDVLDDYAEDLEQAGGKLYLSGLDQKQIRFLEASGKLEKGTEVELFEQTNILSESTEQAHAHAEAWIRDRTGHRLVD